MHFQYHFADRYNWDKDKEVKLSGLTLFKDDAMGDFHRQGLAREFDLVGSVTRTVTWQKGKVPKDIGWQP